MLARWLHVGNERHIVGQHIKIVEFQLHANTAGNGQQMDHKVGGATDGRVDDDGVFKRLPRQYFRQHQIFLHHLHNAPARELRQHFSPRIGGRDGGVLRHRKPQRLHHRGHCGGGSHHGAMALRTRHARFGFRKISFRKVAHLEFLGHAPQIRCADVAAAPTPLEHRPARHHQRRDVHAARTHDQRRRGFIAAAQQYHAVQRIGADGFLHVHARQVAVQHGRGFDQRLAQRHHRKLEREAARLPHAFLDGFGQFAEMAVAGCQFRPCVADADDGLARKFVVRNALVFHPGAVNETVLAGLAEPFL